MRLTFLLIFLGMFSALAKTHSQEITFSGKNVPIERAFEAIKEQTGIVFFYDVNIWKNNRTVSIHADKMPLMEFLDKIFAGRGLEYSLQNKTIGIKPGKNKTTPAFDAAVLDPVLALSTATPIKIKVLDQTGKPLPGITITLKGKKRGASSGANGTCEIAVENGDQIQITSVGYLSLTFKVNLQQGKPLTTEIIHAEKQEQEGVLKSSYLHATDEAIVVRLLEEVQDLEDVEVVINTGYQKLKPNEMAGAVDVITKKMLMEQTGNTVMERLVGMSGSLNFSNKVLPGSTTGNPNSVLNMTIRGYSTINGTTDPLIIVNNFPYTGDIDNLDPNDIENIIILKDAAATAMWGIRAANGVIVITTSGSKFNQKTRVNFRTTTTITPKPNLNKVDVADGPEMYDFIAEYRGKSFGATLGAATAVAEIDYLGWQYYKNGSLTKDEFEARLNVMKALNPKQQWADLLYRTGNAQNYSLNISGGSESLAWTIAGNFDQGTGVLQDRSNRSNIRMNTIYKLTNKLTVELGIAYTSSYSKTGAPAYNSLKEGSRYLVTRPLVNEDGSPYGWWIDKSPIFMDTVGQGLYGDLKFYALEDWKHDYTKTNLTSYVKNFSIKYSPFKDLDLSGNIQSIDQSSIVNNISDSESYFGRYYLALNSEINRTAKSIKYHIPVGAFRRIRNIHAKSFNARMDINYKRAINKGMLLFNGAFDVSEANNFSDGSFLAGYIEMPRSYIFMPTHTVYSSLQNGNINTATAKVNIARLIAPTEITQRNISTTASLSYVYDDRIIFNANARRDGANIIGINVNERWKPNYSLALNWNIHKEKYFNLPLFSTLSAGISFGYLGNVDVSKSSKIVAAIEAYQGSNTDLGRYSYISIPPNPELRWEKTAHTNFKLDIGLWNDRLQIRTNYFIKNISDLYMATSVDPVQALHSNYVANAGKMTVKGSELNILAKVIQSTVNYDITFTTAKIKEKIKYYPSALNGGTKLVTSLQGKSESLGNNPALFLNLPLFSIFTMNGEQGVNDQGRYFITYKGVEYLHRTTLILDLFDKGVDMEGVKLYGTATPKFTGSMHHRINYKRFFLLFSLQAELGHYFKYSKDNPMWLSISSEYYKSWKKAGDELQTNVPSYMDANFSLFSDFADRNVFKGDIIRLNNIQVSYDIPTKKLRALNVSVNIQNIGKIWTANKAGYDYQYLNYMEYKGQNKYYAFTLNVGL